MDADTRTRILIHQERMRETIERNKRALESAGRVSDRIRTTLEQSGPVLAQARAELRKSGLLR